MLLTFSEWLFDSSPPSAKKKKKPRQELIKGMVHNWCCSYACETYLFLISYSTCNSPMSCKGRDTHVNDRMHANNIPNLRRLSISSWDTSFLIPFSKSGILTDFEYRLLRKYTLLRQVFTSGYNCPGSQVEDYTTEVTFLNQCFLTQRVLSKHMLTFLSYHFLTLVSYHICFTPHVTRVTFAGFPDKKEGP